jgi:thiol:disulfide interchange protein
VTESQRPAGEKSTPSPFKPVLVIAIVFIAAAAIFVVSKLAMPGEKIAWRSDFAAARHEAATNRKQVLVYFTADWCGPCQEMKRTVFADDEVERALRFHVPVRIDVDQQPVLAKKYGATSIPHFILIDGDGEVEQSASGKMSSQEFIAWVKRGSKAPPQW